MKPVLIPGVSARPATPGASASLSRASQRLRELAALSGSLTDPLTPALAADVVEQKAMSALGATSAVVVTLGSFPSPGGLGQSEPDPLATLHVVHAIGLPAEVKAALEAQPLDAPLPFADVARDGEPLFLETDSALLVYPDWGTAMILAGAHSAAVVPVWANGELRGVLGLSWPEPREFDEDERAFVLTLGVMCAQAIMRAHLKAAERDARDGAERAQKSAERANESKAHFVATISHELRTPINAVIGYTDLLSYEIAGPINVEQQKHLARMRESGTHLLALIEELLSYARIEAGQETVRPEPMLLNDVVDRSVELVQPIAALKGLTLRVEGLDHAVEMFTDALKVRQILVNLIANAVKFTDSGSVRVVLCIEGVHPEVQVVLDITDTGRGIALEDRETIFDPFWQKDPMAKNSAGSTGLGLSVARQLARLLGGDVVVSKSEIGKGSTLVVSLPARYSAPSAERRDESRGDRRTPRSTDGVHE
ncbi:ATP-binding protein [Gemmatimonas sp.]|uniref:sensor histidine kinase n=1 Tax=Gemmatimonas sp. TaxID=1962908 RepID=UPI00286DA122|nr:ATP-binding protein [Gemmatimonas sp.]